MRKAFPATPSVLKWSGAIFRPRSSTPSVYPFYLCPFYWKPRPSGVSLESPVLENIPQIWATRAKVSENNYARDAVSSTLSGLKCSGAIFRPRSSTPSVRSIYLCPYHGKLRPSGVSLQSPGLENIPQVSANRIRDAQSHDARENVSATLSVLK